MSDSVVEIQIVSETNIKNKFVSIRGKKMELREVRKELKDNLEGDAQYHDQMLRVKDERAKLNKRKLELESIASIQELKNKEQDLKEKLKSDQLTLSDWLVQYVDRTHNETIPDDANNIVKIEIKKIASVKKYD